MTVEMIFEPAAKGCTAAVEPDHLRLYVKDQQYHLPRVLIRSLGEPVEVWDLYVADVAPATGTLGQYVRRNYPTQPWRAGRVGEPREVSPSIPVYEQLRLPGDGAGLSTVRLTWRVTFGQATTRDFTLVLEFVDPATAPETAALSGAGATGQVASEPLRGPVTGDNPAKMFAIDFGTSSSTITMARDRHLHGSDLDPTQDDRLCGDLALLLRSTGPDDTAAHDAWITLRDSCVRQVAEQTRELPTLPERPVGTAEQLAARLDDEEPSIADIRARLRDLVLIGLRPGATTNPVLSHWLAGELHTIIDDALYTPALGASKIAKVPFDLPGDPYAVNSVVHVIQPPQAPARVTLVKPPVDETGLVTSLAGLKRSLARSRPLAPDVAGLDWRPRPRFPAGTDFLVLHAYNWLIDNALRFEAGEGAAPRDPGTVVITYPTTMPPAHRERLRSLFDTDLRVPYPNFTYDEGVAAAMYFVLRELRGSPREGIERFRSRSRRLDVTGRRVWRRTVLVIDIGGGTTDIALLAMDLEDRTPAAAHSPRAGRSYLLTPRVLGSTGHPQLGGDLITLRLFYWIKARLADALVAALPDGQRAQLEGQRWPDACRAPDGGYRPLTPMVLANQTLDPVPPSVREALRELLPTDEESGISRFAFDTLWDEAEAAKIALGRLTGPGLVTVLDTQLDLVLNEVRKSGAPLATAKVTSLDLSGDDFARLVRPVLVKAADLAAGIVNLCLPSAPDEPLDQVFFSGRSAQMPLVRDLVAHALARGLNRPGPGGRPAVAWDPSALVVETTNAKQAASLGACWAEEQHNLHAVPEDGAGLVMTLNRGDSVIDVDVDNLFLSLPCNFFLREPDGGTGLRLLSAGDPCRFSDRYGNVAARSAWFPVPRSLRVHRDLGARESIEWGEFQYHLLIHALRQAGLTLPGDPPADLHFQLQIDQDLTPMIFLCRGGRPDHLVHEPGVDIGQRLPRGCVGPDRTLRHLPVSIHAVGQANPPGGQRRDGRAVVFPAGEALPFAHRMYGLHPDAEPVFGMICELPLPEPVEAPGGRRAWRFEAVDASGEVTTLAEMATPDGPYRDVQRYFASLDHTGCLRVHLGYPRYLATTRFTDMLNHAGTVFQTGLSEGKPMWNDLWDPFTGRH